jgi:hypothetical protein
MNYPGKWTAGLEGEAKVQFEEILGVNNKVLDKLAKICYNMINEVENTSSDFDTPNWALRQADLVGQRRALMKVIKLCTPATERDPAQ